MTPKAHSQVASIKKFKCFDLSLVVSLNFQLNLSLPLSQKMLDVIYERTPKRHTHTTHFTLKAFYEKSACREFQRKKKLNETLDNIHALYAS